MASTAHAQVYRIKVIATELDRPTGIAVALNGNVCFTELPTPGVSGNNGGSNKVSRLNPKNGRIRTVSTGEPEPANVATTFFGDVYWTCKSAGVINELDGHAVANVTAASTNPQAWPPTPSVLRSTSPKCLPPLSVAITAA